MLFAVADANLDAELIVEVFGQVLGAIDTAMLAACAAEREHQGSKASLDVTAYVGIGQFIDGVEEGENLTIVFQKADDWLIKACQLLIRLVSAGVMGTAAIKDIAATIATLVFRNTLPI